jgi:hypothetical protein
MVIITSMGKSSLVPLDTNSAKTGQSVFEENFTFARLRTGPSKGFSGK